MRSSVTIVVFFVVLLTCINFLYPLSCPHCLSIIDDKHVKCPECKKWINKEIRYVQKSIAKKIDFIVTTSTSKFDKVIFKMTLNNKDISKKLNLLDVTKVKLGFGRSLYEYHYRTEKPYKFKEGTKIIINGKVIYKNRYRKFHIERYFADMKNKRSYYDLRKNKKPYTIKSKIVGWEIKPYKDIQIFADNYNDKHKYEYKKDEFAE
ncbi:hypothetical protein KAJ27_20765 [bacterium]|nr:hypothetical protein [bacterium]